MTAVSITELTAESAELLPTRETLFFDTNIAGVYASNTALAVNAGSLLANAQAAAFQAVTVIQG